MDTAAPTRLPVTMAGIGSAATIVLLVLSILNPIVTPTVGGTVVLLITAAGSAAAGAGLRYRRRQRHINDNWALAVLCCWYVTGTCLNLVLTPDATGYAAFSYILLTVSLSGAVQLSPRLWWLTVAYISVLWASCEYVALNGTPVDPYITVPAYAVTVVVSYYVHTHNTAQTQALRAAYACEASRADSDHLTGLLNRSGVVKRVTAVIDTSSSGDTAGMACTFVDINGLKTINDTAGHDAGDAAIVAVADAITATTRPDDIAGRWGGDEFVVIHPDTAPDPDEFRRRIHNWIRAHRPTNVSVTVGTSRHHHRSLAELVNDADHNMYTHRTQQQPQPQ